MNIELLRKIDAFLAEWQIARGGKVLPAEIQVNPEDLPGLLKAIAFLNGSGGIVREPHNFRSIPVVANDKIESEEFKFIEPKKAG